MPLCRPRSGRGKLRSITSLCGMERAARILWTLVVVQGPVTLTATVLSVLLSAALQDTVRTTSLLDEERLLWTCVLRRLSQLCPRKSRPAVLQFLEVKLLQAVASLSFRTTTARLTARRMTTVPTGHSVFITSDC